MIIGDKICETIYYADGEDTWECPCFHYRISFDDGIVLSLVKEDYSPEYQGDTGEEIEMVVSSTVLARFDGDLKDYVNLVISFREFGEMYEREYGVNLNNIVFEPVLDNCEERILMRDTVEFEVISKLIDSVTIKGYVNIDEIDDENPLRFYDHQGLECGSYVPSNPYKDGAMLWNDAYEELSCSFQSDEMFLQFLSDYSDENKTVDRGEYLLKINDGGL